MALRVELCTLLCTLFLFQTFDLSLSVLQDEQSGKVASACSLSFLRRGSVERSSLIGEEEEEEEKVCDELELKYV